MKLEEDDPVDIAALALALDAKLPAPTTLDGDIETGETYLVSGDGRTKAEVQLNGRRVVRVVLHTGP
jgi:hypothetical protein